MKNGALGIAVAAAILLMGSAVAEEHGKPVTIEGSMACAHCVLKDKDLTSCQDVVLVKGGDGESRRYYLKSNETLKKFGHACTGSKDVKITGTVTEKDGKTWLEPASIEPLKKA